MKHGKASVREWPGCRGRGGWAHLGSNSETPGIDGLGVPSPVIHKGDEGQHQPGWPLCCGHATPASLATAAVPVARAVSRHRLQSSSVGNGGGRHPTPLLPCRSQGRLRTVGCSKSADQCAAGAPCFSTSTAGFAPNLPSQPNMHLWDRPSISCMARVRSPFDEKLFKIIFVADDKIFVHSCCRIRHCPRLERTRRRPASREDREGVGGPAGGARAPRGHHPTPPAGGAMPGGRRPAPVASPAHHCAKRSPQCGSWAGRDAGWAGHVPVITSPRRLGRRAAAGHRPDRLGRGPGRPVRACLGARERKRENGAGMLPCALA